MTRSPFLEDSAAHQVAEALGFSLERKFRRVEITDEAALIRAGFVKAKPCIDYAAVAKALDAGIDVPGAEWGPTEYVLRPRGQR